MPDLLGIIAQIGNKKAAMSIMPWAMKNPKKQIAPPEEVAAAQAELEDGIVFS